MEQLQFSEKELLEKWPKARQDLWSVEKWLCCDYLVTSEQLNMALSFAGQAFDRLAGQQPSVNRWIRTEVHKAWDQLRAQLVDGLAGIDDPRLSEGQLEVALQLADKEIA